MGDLSFSAQIRWESQIGQRVGEAETGGQTVVWSAPASMGGSGVGTSPEEFLLCAVGSCYSATLYGVLRRQHLPVNSLSVRVEGKVTGYPDASRFAAILVHPMIREADRARAEAYESACHEARDRCFIGRTVRDTLEYVVGEISYVD